MLAIQERALLQIAVLLDRLDELERETFDVDAPDYVRIDELKSVTQRLRAKIDADHDDSPETKADLENAEQELRVLREIRDDQHLPSIMEYRLSKLTKFLGSEFGDLVYHPWPLTKPTARRRRGSGGAL